VNQYFTKVFPCSFPFRQFKLEVSLKLCRTKNHSPTDARLALRPLTAGTSAAHRDSTRSATTSCFSSLFFERSLSGKSIHQADLLSKCRIASVSFTSSNSSTTPHPSAKLALELSSLNAEAWMELQAWRFKARHM
jgi:hypothetical protein